MAGIFRDWSPVIRCIGNSFFIPVFVLLVVLSFVFTLVAMLSATAVADVCVSSPDAEMLLLLSFLKDNLSAVVYEFAVFYILQCPPSLLPTVYAVFIRVSTVFVSGLYGLSRGLEKLQSPLERYCGADTEVVSSLSTTSNALACDLSVLLAELITFFHCSSWRSLYETGVYDTICYSGTSGLVWIASTQIVILLFSGVMLTFRVGFMREQRQVLL